MAREQKRHANRQETANDLAAPGVSFPGSKRNVEDRILNALAVVADLLDHDEAYLSIFLRLEAELEKAKAQQSALKRAKSFAQTLR
jgi:hypothetical protein